MLELLRALVTRVEGWLLLVALGLATFYVADSIVAPWIATSPSYVWRVIGMAWGAWAGWRALRALTN